MASNTPPDGSVEIRDVCFDYPLYRHIVLDRMREMLGDLVPALKPPHRRVLNGINFSIAPGETVGLIGVNGAGKTTLLKIISGMLSPTSGTAQVQGRLVALLAMGMGFRANFTGRENVRFGSILLGMSAAECDTLMPVIHDFSGLGSAFDQPYFTYSSGMKARLGFSLGAHVPSDILILDETLSAGDRRFVTRCYSRLQEIRREGRTILFVSHNAGEIARMTNRVIFLDSGKVAFDGQTQKGLLLYEENMTKQLVADVLAQQAEGGTPNGQVLDYAGARLRPQVYFTLAHSAQPCTQIPVGAACQLHLEIESDRTLGESFIFMRLSKASTGEQTAYFMLKRFASLLDNFDDNQNVLIKQGKNAIVWDIPFWPTAEGEYLLDVYIGPPVQARDLDISAGRTWYGLTAFRAVYSNAYYRGSMCELEVPVTSVQVSHD